LRAPFPPEQIGKLPKGGIQLDYVSHAWVTDRLLQVDPEWSWEPMAVDAYGAPMIDDRGGLWIRLTVLGITRIGYGNGTGPEAVKIAIGDAIRNAAMRFGVALDLWEKETPEWEQDAPTKRPTRTKPKQPVDDHWSTAPEPPAGVEKSGTPIPDAVVVSAPPAGSITAAQVKLVNVLAADVGLKDRAVLHEGITRVVGRDVTSVKQLTKGEAVTVIEALQARLPKAAS
jgi:hypothetical protein